MTAAAAATASVDVRRRRRRRVRLLVVAVVAVGLVAMAILTLVGAAGRQQAEHPDSVTGNGAGALGQLLGDEGITVTTTDSAASAGKLLGPDVTLVVARPAAVSAEQARDLLGRGAGRVVLLRPSSPALAAFGVRAKGQAPDRGVLQPSCGVRAATQAGAVTITDANASYQPTGSADLACYRGRSGGYNYLVVPTSSGVPVQLLAGGIANDVLAEEGNAALALNVLGSQPRVVWLMATRERPDSSADAAPTLLPAWWQYAFVQAAIGLVVVGIWRGRRLGPIIAEALPVRVRATETVEGHGRLYQRIDARDRAATALREGCLARLSQRFGQSAQPGSDPSALIGAVATRTGRDPREVGHLLAGPDPTTDADLVALARHLDQLEEEARQL